MKKNSAFSLDRSGNRGVIGRRTCLLAAGLLTFLVLRPGATVFGQVITGTIMGRVVDTSGGVIPSATITVTNEATNTKTTTVTDKDGNYAIPLLPIASYTVAVSKKDFKTSFVSAVRV